MRTPVRTAAVTAAAFSLALLVTACGGGQQADDQGKGPAKGSAPGASATSVTPSAPARKALTLAELDQAIIGQADLRGYKVEKGKGPGVTSAGVIVEKDACKPIADAMYSIPHHLAFATAESVAAEVPKKDGAAAPEDAVMRGLGAAVTFMTLSSYEADGAGEALSSVKESAAACPDGFTFTIGQETTKVLSVAPAPVSVGDEALAWKVTVDMGSVPHDGTVVVFRKGGTVAVASTTSSTPGGSAKLPQALLDAQAAKLS